MQSVIVVGARRRRQGIGEFVARAILSAGAGTFPDLRLAGIVGTSPDTVEEARRRLAPPAGVEAPRGYTDLDTALARERPDIVVLCSPYACHAGQLETVAAAGCHCLCEKPMWWRDGLDAAALACETARLAGLFIARGRLLRILEQWPFTLEAFWRLHPGARSGPVETFDMLLGPISRGHEMVLDAAPHALSILARLLRPDAAGDGPTGDRPTGDRPTGDRPTGVGTEAIAAASAGILDVEPRYADDTLEDLSLGFVYRHAAGATRVRCRFRATPQPPRPAGYAIDGLGALRRIALPGYEMRFEAAPSVLDDRALAAAGAAPIRQVPLADPLHDLIADFILATRSGVRTDRQALVASMARLRVLVEACRRAEER